MSDANSGSSRKPMLITDISMETLGAQKWPGSDIAYSVPGVTFYLHKGKWRRTDNTRATWNTPQEAYISDRTDVTIHGIRFVRASLRARVWLACIESPKKKESAK